MSDGSKEDDRKKAEHRLASARAAADSAHKRQRACWERVGSFDLLVSPHLIAAHDAAMAEWLDAHRVFKVAMQELIDAQAALDRLGSS